MRLATSKTRKGCGRLRLQRRRKGVIVVLTAIILVAVFSFCALGIDTARITLTQTQMQNAVDAAAMAASQEITAAIQNAGEEGENAGDANSIAIAAARAKAVEVAAANGVYLDPERDVEFGKRSFDPETNSWPIQWGVEPYNVVRVIAHRDQEDTSQPDGEFPLAFGWAVGRPSVPLATSATAFVEARDLVVVVDFSRSMNDDSELRSIGKLSQSDIEDNMEEIFAALQPVDCGNLEFQPQYLTIEGDPDYPSQAQIDTTFKYKKVFVDSSKKLKQVRIYFNSGGYQTFNNPGGKSGTFKGTGWKSGKEIYKVRVKSGKNPNGSNYYAYFQDTNTAVKQAFGLTGNYPYNSGSWNDFINYCRYDGDVKNAGYRKMYGGLTWVNYLLENKAGHNQTDELWKTPHYPFHAQKNGLSLFCQFLEELDFGDEIGLVSYVEYARIEDELDYGGYNIDISNDPITNDYNAIDTIQRHRQAGQFGTYTGMGDGVYEARQLLDQYARHGARPTILVITDGNANRSPSGWSLPNDWDWADWTDYDGDGDADYTTNNKHKQYAFWEATQGVDSGYLVHTMSVGASADRDLMEAIAFAGGGTWIDVPGGTTIADMHEQMLGAFSEIAAKVPPPKLVYEGNGEQ